MELVIFNAHVNILAVVAAMIANIVVGMIYFNPKVMGTKWMKLTGKSMNDANAKTSDYLYSMLAGFVMAFVLSVFISYAYTNAFIGNAIGEVFQGLGDQTVLFSGSWSSLATGIIVALMAWIGFVVTSASNEVIWEKRSFQLYLITALHQLISLLTMGILIALIVGEKALLYVAY